MTCKKKKISPSKMACPEIKGSPSKPSPFQFGEKEHTGSQENQKQKSVAPSKVRLKVPRDEPHPAFVPRVAMPLSRCSPSRWYLGCPTKHKGRVGGLASENQGVGHKHCCCLDHMKSAKVVGGFHVHCSTPLFLWFLLEEPQVIESNAGILPALA